MKLNQKNTQVVTVMPVIISSKELITLDVKLSPIEHDALKSEWKKSDFNSVAQFVRNKIFGGDETKIDLYWDQKQEDKNLTKHTFRVK